MCAKVERVGFRNLTSIAGTTTYGYVYEYSRRSLLGSSSSSFSDLVVAGEQIENCLKNGKNQDVVIVSNRAKKLYFVFTKKKEGGTNASTIAKEEPETYQVPYYQVVEIAPN